MSAKLLICNKEPISLPQGFSLEISDLAEAVNAVNTKLRDLQNNTEKMALNIFEAIDFRMLSGLIGETLVATLATPKMGFKKNPNIDGYPDLLNVSRKEFLEDYDNWLETDFRKFIKYPHGGLEVKNTFGTKKSGVQLAPGESRVGKINKKLDWKAHHRYTNNLIAVVSDFVDGCPQIIAVLYSDKLIEDDWAEKQNPKEGSTMTSFSVIKSSGCSKLQEDIKLCMDLPAYKEFFGITI